MTDTNFTGLEIAVIGMAGRFPGAANLHQFWENLKHGVETTSFYSEEELLANNTDPQLLKNPAFVKTSGSPLEHKEYFDASFFGYTPVEARTLDPQTRLFMETCWHALEDGGYDPTFYNGLIGLYGGSGWNFQWELRVNFAPEGNALGTFASWLLSNRDNLCTLTSYRLGLRGPAIFLKTTCSTSLVAIHLASQAILNGECHMALAGGVNVNVGPGSGYLYQEGMIQSSDGHCRAFDALARGTIGGEGVGVVLLKRLEDAIEDRDFIHAIIKGTAINNDGSRKIGYTAPSIFGQADVIREALTVADVEPESISYVETHGTGTPVGDPIEIEALSTAYASEKKEFCLIGSVKTNIGHLDAAAGIAGFIKTVLSLKHQLIPPSLFYATPNPKINFANTPFRVNNTLSEWPDNGFPKRAGISSFGIGGTNAHMILQEAPVPAPTEVSPFLDFLVLLSARTSEALAEVTTNISAYISAHPHVPLADITYTLQTGRRAFKHRRMLLCSETNRQALIDNLGNPDSKSVFTQVLTQEQKDVIFMFPGLGAEYVNMGVHLYQQFPVFRDHIEHCTQILASLSSIPFRDILYPPQESQALPFSIHAPEIAPVVIFMFEYALAQLVLSWGIRPRAMIGYSFGEYVAACLADVFTVDQALAIVLMRGSLLQQTSEGAMLSVPAPKEKVLPLMAGSALSLAIDNGPSCILAGTVEAISAFEKIMKEQRLLCMRLPNANRALHSAQMNPVLESFTQYLQRFTFNAPRIPYISNVTGTWVDAAQVTTPAYWSAHLSQTVHFYDGVNQLLHHIGWETPACTGVLLEIGAGFDLGVLVRYFSTQDTPMPVYNLIDIARGTSSPNRYLLNHLGRLWLAGVAISWPLFYDSQKRQRLPLPLYPFEGQPYVIEFDLAAAAQSRSMAGQNSGKKANMADWFYVPNWKRSLWLSTPTQSTIPPQTWLLFADESPICQAFALHLQQQGQEVVRVHQGQHFQALEPQHYQLNPTLPEDYVTLCALFNKEKNFPHHIVFFWTVTNPEPALTDEQVQQLGFYSLFYLVQAVGKHSISEPLHITVVSNGLHRVVAAEELHPAKATLLGAVNVIPREYFNITCRSVDIELPTGTKAIDRLVSQLMSECRYVSPADRVPERVVAYRDAYRWVQVFEACPGIQQQTPIPPFKERGVYLITGGLGGIGLEMARHLAKTYQARLILTRRSSFPARAEWPHLVQTLPPEDPTRQKITILQEMENSGAEVFIACADVTDSTGMQTTINQAMVRFGTINGVIHAAGLPDGGVIALRTFASVHTILAPKVTGTLVLHQCLQQARLALDFFLLCSSISSVFGTFGQIAYCAANAFLDAFAHYNTQVNGQLTYAINWELWQEVGMGVETIKRLQKTDFIADGEMLLRDGLSTSEGLTIMDNVLASPYPQVVISTSDLDSRFMQVQFQNMPATSEQEKNATQPTRLHPRPALSTEYVEPATPFEKQFAEILQQYFGFQQVGIEDNLFEYGITSLDMIHINNTLKEKLQLDIPIVVMFEYPTIHSLGSYLESRDSGPNELESHLQANKPVEDLDAVEETLHESLNLFDM